MSSLWDGESEQEPHVAELLLAAQADATRCVSGTATRGLEVRGEKKKERWLAEKEEFGRMGKYRKTGAR
jgi:hypothetical protein